MKTKNVRKFVVVMLSMVMMVSFVLPAHANTAGGEFELTDFEIFSIFNGNTIVEQSWNAQLTDEEIESIHEAVLSGTFVQSRAMSNVEVTYLGNVDGLYDVVEIVETTFSAMTRSGEIFEEVISTRVGFSHDWTGVYGSNDGLLRVTATLRWQQTSIFFSNNWVTALRINFFRIHASALGSGIIVEQIHGNVGQYGHSMTPDLSRSAGMHRYVQDFNINFRPNNTSTVAIEGHLPFMHWLTLQGLHFYTMNGVVTYSGRTFSFQHGFWAAF